RLAAGGQGARLCQALRARCGFVAPLKGGHAAARRLFDGAQQSVGVVPLGGNAIDPAHEAQGPVGMVHDWGRVWLMRRGPMPAWKVEAVMACAWPMAACVACGMATPWASCRVRAQASGPSGLLRRVAGACQRQLKVAFW